MKKHTTLSVLALLALSAGTVCAQVTSKRLAQTDREPENWLTYSGDYAGKRYSRLKQIDTTNVQKLTPQWVFQTRGVGAFEATPLFFDNILYFTGQENVAYALDARTGRTLWQYRHSLPDGLSLCCGLINRGLATLGNKVFMATLDAHVVALDVKRGNVIWDVASDDYHDRYTFTLAPLVA